jgi:hypothetical protein
VGERDSFFNFVRSKNWQQMSPQNIPPNLVQNALGNQKKFQKHLWPQVSKFSPNFFKKIHIYIYIYFFSILGHPKFGECFQKKHFAKFVKFYTT